MLRTALAALTFLAASTAALADTYTPFALNASLVDHLDPSEVFPVTGTVLIDTTTGTLPAQTLDLTYANGAPLPLPLSDPLLLSDQSQVGGYTNLVFDYFENFGDGFVEEDELNLTLPVSSLVGYTGGTICSPGVCPFGDYSLLSEQSLDYGAIYIVTGSLTTATTATPEPSTLLLLTTGALAAVTRLRRKPRTP